MKRYLGINLLILGFFILDRIAKNFFWLTNFQHQTWLGNFGLIKNNYVFFGYLPNNTFFLLLTVIIIGFLIYKLQQAYQKKEARLVTGLTLIILGGFSNLLDRIKYSAVIDYLIIPGWSFFNIADLMIWAGIILLIITIKSHPKRS